LIQPIGWRIELAKRGACGEIGKLDEVGVSRVSGNGIVDQSCEWDLELARSESAPSCSGTPSAPGQLSDRCLFSFVVYEKYRRWPEGFLFALIAKALK
jgi:hypothetical protein